MLYPPCGYSCVPVHRLNVILSYNYLYGGGGGPPPPPPPKTSYTLTAGLLPNDPQGNARFGNSVSINATGNVAVVGAYYWDGPAGANQGKAYIFQDVGGTWQQVAELLPNDPQASALFGFSVSMNSAGDVVIVGAYNWTGTVTSQGKVYVFQNIGGTWQQVAELLPSDPQASAQFGFSVSLNSAGDVAIVGAHAWDGGLTNQGKAYIFQNIGGTWQQVAELLPDDPQSNSYFGRFVSINSAGDAAIVGVQYWSGSAGTYQGKAYIFQNIGGTWQQVAGLLPSDPQAYARFGTSVSISGDIAMVGAPQWDGATGGNQGKVYIFQNVGGTWQQVAELLPNDPQFAAEFGYSVSINSTGDVAVVGAIYWDGAVANQGKAYVFQNTDGTWQQVAELLPDDPQSNSYFGGSVSIKGNVPIVGAFYWDGSAGADQGKVYIFDP